MVILHFSCDIHMFTLLPSQDSHHLKTGYSNMTVISLYSTASQSPDLIINISRSPQEASKATRREIFEVGGTVTVFSFALKYATLG